MLKRGLSGILVGVAGAAIMAFSSLAFAVPTVTTISGNDCAGVFGNGFDNCKVSSTYDPNESPVIIKFDDYANKAFGKLEINSSLFPTIDGSEFSFFIPFDDGSVGTWTYTPGVGDPDINFFVAKGSDSFNLFNVVGYTDVGWFTPTNNGGQLAGLSHLTFYDTGGRVPPTGLPEPGTLLLLGAALGGLGFARRRKQD